MVQKFIPRGATERKANVKSVVQRKVDPRVVATALDAKPISNKSSRFLDVLEVRQALQSMVRSSGGRPGITSAVERVKIPRIEEDWAKLEELASKLREPGQTESKLSLAQVAAVVLHLALERLPVQVIQEALKSNRAAR